MPQLTQEQQEALNNIPTQSTEFDPMQHTLQGQVQPAQEVEQEQQVQQPEEQVQQPEEQNQQDVDQFAEELKNRYGLTPEQLQAGIETFQQQSLQEQTNELQKAWNVNQQEFTRRLAVLQQNYGQFIDQNPQFDTVDGLKQLWALYETSNTNMNKPSTTISSATPAKPSYDFTESQIKQMDEKTMRENYSAILAAYANGRVLKNL